METEETYQTKDIANDRDIADIAGGKIGAISNSIDAYIIVINELNIKRSKHKNDATKIG